MDKKSNIIAGRVYVLGDNIDTDLIIPACYLNLVPNIPEEYKKLGSYALSGLPDSYPTFVKKGESKSEFTIIVGGKNFGCGSSREHAVTALAAAGIKAVVAESYARIFFRNSVATGEIYPLESEESLQSIFKTGTQAEIDTANSTITDVASKRTFKLKSLGAVGPVIDAGGIFGYARSTGMIKKNETVETPHPAPSPAPAQDTASQPVKTLAVAVANQKGGVGKTTTAINLAACLAEMNKKVLVIDLDPQANATSGLGLPLQKDTSLYKALLGEADITTLIQHTPFPNLDIIPSELDLAGSEVFVARQKNYLHCFKTALAPVLSDGLYDFVIIDCPPSLGILTMNALTAAHSIMIPIQCEYYALEGLSVIARLVQQLRESGANPELEIEGIVMTMYDGRNKLSEQVVDEVRKHFPDKIYDSIIPRNVRLSESPSFGKPVIHYDRNSTGSKAYMVFAEEFANRRNTAG